MKSNMVKGKPQVVLTSDALGSWGCGAYLMSGEWFQLELPRSWAGVHITIKELLPIVIGAAVWGRQWKERSVLCRCNNAAVVAIVNLGRSKVEQAMHLMRSLFFFLARWNVYCQHIPRVENGVAYALSQNDLPLLQPEVCRPPTVLPGRILQALVVDQPDWTVTSWASLLTTSTRKG